jgi:hypothetical protein
MPVLFPMLLFASDALLSGAGRPESFFAAENTPPALIGQPGGLEGT